MFFFVHFSIVVCYTVPTLMVTTNALIHQYSEIENGRFVIDGGAPSVTCTSSDSRAPVLWLPSISDIDPTYQARLSPPGLEHTLSFPSVYETTVPNTTMYFWCTHVNIESTTGVTSPRVEVILRFIQCKLILLKHPNKH